MTESFIQRLRKIFDEHAGEPFSLEIFDEIVAAWKETCDHLKQSLDDIMGVLFYPKNCLQCGRYTFLNSNGLCDDCLQKITHPKTSIDLQEG